MFIFRWIGKAFHFVATCLKYFNKTLLYVLELIVIVVLVAGLFSFFHTPQIQPNSILLLDLQGTVKESPTNEAALPLALAPANSSVSLHELLATIDKAAKDPLVSGVLLKLDGLDKVGLASTIEIGKALDRYKVSGKPIWAWGTNFSQAQYAIAAHANEIYMHPMGEVFVKGLASNRLYYGDLLKALGVNVHVFKAGAYKSFPESFIANKPSKEWIESERFWLDDAWKTLAREIENSRGLMPGSITQYIETLPTRLQNANGDLATTALNANLIDGTQTFDQMIKTIENKLGPKQKGEANLVSYADYAARLNTQSGEIAVVIAEGEIQEGESQAGVMGAESLVKLIDRARENKNIKALVLRVNSPGGSAVASELIRHALERTKAVKPVVVSMGDMAASGGYWISMGGSRVLASEATVTGSIGVFGLAPTFERTLQLAKIGQAAVTTTWLANAERLSQPMDPRMESILTQSVARTYSNFINVVAQSRKLSTQYVQSVAQGRVWTGTQAQSRQLVDQIGNFRDALSLARSLAKMDTNAGAVYLIDSKPDFGSMIRENFGDWFNPLGLVGVPESVQKELKQGHSLLQKAEGRSQLIFVHSLLQPLQ